MESAEPKHKYEISHTETSETGIRLFKVRDPDTNFVVTFAEFNKDFDVHVGLAWAGARTSRSPDPYEEIFQEVMELVKEDPVAAAEKIRKFGLDYGHSSILGMSPIFLFMNNIPMEVAFWLFNHMSTGDGQELSSRYVNFGDLQISDVANFLDFEGISDFEAGYIKNEWLALQEIAVANYGKWKELVREAYTKQFMSDDQSVKIPESTMNARVLDIARMWIPIGAATSMCLLGNLRLWNDFIKKLQETGEQEYIQLAEQIKQVLKLKETDEGKDIQANLSGLVKYTDPQFTIKENKIELETYLSTMQDFRHLLASRKTPESFTNETVVTKVESIGVGEIIVMQYILTLYPDLDEVEILNWLRTQDSETKRELGRIVMQGHDQHNLMGNMGDVRGRDIYVIESAMAYLRDLNRHRADGRLIPMFETKDYGSIIKDGFNQNYQLMNTEGLKALLPEWEGDAEEYYSRLTQYYEFLVSKFPEKDLEFIKKLLLLGHQTKIHLSAPITQWNYMISQRSTGGNDFGNRNIVYKILTDIREDDYLADAMSSIQEPDPNSLVEFKSRK